MSASNSPLTPQAEWCALLDLLAAHAECDGWAHLWHRLAMEAQTPSERLDVIDRVCASVLARVCYGLAHDLHRDWRAFDHLYGRPEATACDAAARVHKDTPPCSQ